MPFRVKAMPLEVETGDTRETRFLRTRWVHGLQKEVGSTGWVHWSFCHHSPNQRPFQHVWKPPSVINFIPVLLDHNHLYRSEAEVANLNLDTLEQKCHH